MSDNNAEKGESFFEMLARWLQSLPTDTKILVEMIGDNELDAKARSLAAGTIIYLIARIDLIPDDIPILGHIDDVIILHIAVATIMQIDPNRGKYYREKYPQFETLNQQIRLLTETLGALYGFLKALVENFVKRRFRGQTTENVASSEKLREDMFDAAMQYAAGVNVDPEAIQRALLTAPPDRIIKLLSDGLEQEAKRQEKEDQTSGTRSLDVLPGPLRKLIGHREQG
jgi:uncharacterized membrane protein YkvA (DUF1232 family)